MKKIKYHYNPDTCSYEPTQTSTTSYLLQAGVVACLAVLLATGLFSHYVRSYTSPKEAELLEANKRLQEYYRVVQAKIEKSTLLLAALQERDDALYRVLLNAPPLSSVERNAGMGGVDKYAHLSHSQDKLIAQTLSKIDQLTSKLAIQKKSFDALSQMAKTAASRLESTPSFPPIPKKDLKRISAAFGKRFHPVYHIYRQHEGIDLAAKIGSPIYAAANGVVKSVKREKTGYGKSVLIVHGNGFSTLYGHMHSFLVMENQRVHRGQQIGTVGNTGASTAPHLHFAVYHNGNAVDPVPYFVAELTPSEYDLIRRQAAHQNRALCSNF